MSSAGGAPPLGEDACGALCSGGLGCGSRRTEHMHGRNTKARTPAVKAAAASAEHHYQHRRQQPAAPPARLSSSHLQS